MKNEPWIDQQLSIDLPEIRTSGESQEVEFKREFPKQATDLAKEIAAFATSNSGLILLGVDNSGDLKGLKNVETPDQRDVLVSRIAGICTNSIKPSVTPRIQWAKEDEYIILAISVSKGSEPIYYFRNRPYLRHLSDSRPAEPHEVLDLVRRHLAIHGSDPDNKNETPESILKSSIAGALNKVLIWEDIPKNVRHVKPALYEWRADCQGAADRLRTLSSNDTAVKLGIADQLLEVADALDNLANFQLYLGCNPELKKVEEKAYSVAKKLKKEFIDPMPLPEGSKAQIKDVLNEQCRLLMDLARRSESMANEGRIDDLKNEVGRIGSLLAQIAFYRIDFLSPDAQEVIHTLALKLRTLQYKSIYVDGGASLDELISDIRRCADNFRQFTSKIA